MVTRDVHGQSWPDKINWHVRLDLSAQRLRLEVPDPFEWTDGPEPELAPTAAAVGYRRERFASASMLAITAKLFDDGVYAAAELAEQPAKIALLKSLASVAPIVAAAARLGGAAVPASPAADRITREFLDTPRLSKPLGFYTWTDELRRIFQQDRLLQGELGAADADALRAALASDPAAQHAYVAHLETAARMTNALKTADLRSAGGRVFFPPSRSHEGSLIEQLYGNRPIPDGFSLVDELIARIRNGSIAVAPTDRSGWYDYQTWALEPLIVLERMPEASRIEFNEHYRAQLEDVFKATIALTRETHVKQLAPAECGSAMGSRPVRVIADIAPEMTVEPLPTHYERRADAYAFVRSVLQTIAPLGSMRRLNERGVLNKPLDEELAGMESLFRGAAAVSREELGIAAAGGADARRFRGWLESPDGADADVRMMVPVFHDIERDQTKVWAILGWTQRSLRVSFAAPPAAQIVTGASEVKFSSTYPSLVYPVFAETYVSRILDRDEFRSLCDRYKTRSAILERLKADM